MTCKCNAYFSYNQKALAKGCKRCVKGRKTVLFITGFCPRKCFYCPVSDHKMYKDVQYANERPITTVEELIDEITVCQSNGVGITGGDPLVKIERVCTYISRLKEVFGPSFHIHLYTSLNLLTEKNVTKLVDAGLDELRIHPDVYDTKLWSRLSVLNLFKGDTGIEIPAIPGTKNRIQQLIDIAPVDFFVLNELEYSETHQEDFATRQLFCKNRHSYAIKGSKEMSLTIIKNNPNKRIHFCTAKLKDATQLTRRMKLRGKSIIKPYQFMQDDGTLLRAEIQNIDANILAQKLMTDFDVPKKLLHIKNEKTIEIAPWVVLQLKENIPGKKILFTQYPTFDSVLLEEEEL